MYICAYVQGYWTIIMDTNQNQPTILIDLIPHKTYCSLIQKGNQYVTGKIKNATWTEGSQYFKDPDGQIWVSLKGVESWIRAELEKSSARQIQQVLDPLGQASKSDSAGRRSGTNRSGTKSRTRETSSPPSTYALI